MFPVRFGLANLLEPSTGADAIWWSFPAGSLASMLMTIGYYRHGGWRKGRMATAAGKEECEEQALAEGQATNKPMPVG